MEIKSRKFVEYIHVIVSEHSTSFLFPTNFSISLSRLFIELKVGKFLRSKLGLFEGNIIVRSIWQNLNVSWDILCNVHKCWQGFVHFAPLAMSAKEFYDKPSLRVPEIPPEVWGTVLRHATWDYRFPFPSELTFESLGSPRWYTSDRLQSFREALVRSCIRLSINPDLCR
jgi:hypothetical protein